ncbi:hypothetical protein E2C01_030691 [Portunus trituberculatus]|uniref:Uncharacterized protein n=1 Tax=Portunus trituberculatus TaxID=210409 RepID=A0A5B7EVI6_PORTR|nr:hypothetical protein [Portunus trituberculatus]
MNGALPVLAPVYPQGFHLSCSHYHFLSIRMQDTGEEMNWSLQLLRLQTPYNTEQQGNFNQF